MSIKRDDSKECIHNRYDLIKVGDVVFEDCNGPCSGGALYGIGVRVTEVTETIIHTANAGQFSRSDGEATCPPWAYYISYWQKG